MATTYPPVYTTIDMDETEGNEFLSDFLGTWSFVFMASSCIIAVILNSVILGTIAFSSKLRNKRSTFIANLALADNLSAITLLYFLFGDVGPWIEPVFNALLVESVLNIFALAIDRSIALKWAPLKYDKMVTAPKCVVVCVFLWILPFAIYLPPFLLDSYEHVGYVFTPIFIPTLLVITAVNYILVFRSIHSFDMSILDHEVAKFRKRQSRKLLLTFALILVSSFVCWLPMCVILLLEYFLDENEVVSHISGFTFALVALNSALNPVIFFWRVPDLSDSLKTMCQCLPCAKWFVTTQQPAFTEDDKTCPTSVSQNNNFTKNEDTSF